VVWGNTCQNSYGRTWKLQTSKLKLNELIL
jgi:hypothetical protein